MNTPAKAKRNLIAIVALLVVIIFLWPAFFPRLVYRSPAIIELGNLKDLGIVLQSYAWKHGGKFPARISDLPNYGRLPESIRQFRDPTTNETHDWLYYPGHTTGDPSDPLLAASPVILLAGQRVRMVTSVDTVTRIVSDLDFQQEISTQHK